MVEFGKVHVKISGLTPLLMNKLDPEDLKEKTAGPKKVYDPKVEARKAAYLTTVDGKEQLYIPERWLYSMIVKAGGEYKRTGKRTSASSVLAGTIRIEPEKILLGTSEYEIDERPVRIMNARVLAWRPKINKWTVDFDIIYNKAYFAEAGLGQLKLILEDGAIRLGIGDFRPQHKGWFGTFTVEKFEIAE